MSQSRADLLQAELDRRQALEQELVRRQSLSSQQQNIPSSPFPLQINQQDFNNPLVSSLPQGTPQEWGKAGLQAVGTVGMMAQPEFALMKGVGYIPNAINAISRIGGNAGIGAMASPEHPIAGALTNVLLPSVLSSIGKTYNTLKPSNLFRGNLSPEQLKENLRIAEGTQTGLGDVIGSPGLKRLQENIVSKLPFSGANDKMLQTAGTIVNKGHDILSDILGNQSPEDFEKQLNQSLQDVYNEHLSNKNNLYEKVNNLAKNSNLKLEFPNFSNNVDSYIKALEDTNVLKFEPDVLSLINKLKNYKNINSVDKNIKNIVDKSGNPIINEEVNNPATLKEANLLKGRLNQLSEEYGSSPNTQDRMAANVFGKLSSSLKNDIINSIKKSGNNEILDEYNNAENNYANNFSPFLDREIYKFAKGNADPDLLISSFIKTGKSTDRANLLEKLMSKLPNDKKNLLGYGYLQRALDENNVINPLKLKTLISKNSLGSRQFESLFPNPETRNKLRDYVKLIDMNTKGLKLMQNPETGQMAMDVLPLISKKPSGFLSKLALARPVSNALTSQNIRENLVNKMINNPNQ